ncbi:MAG: MOSC domain-containing protein [Patescibacteria group bacterium]
MEKIGSVEKLRRYPVKSMAGEEIAEAFAAYTGIVGDRVWSLVDKQKEQANFPWFSARDAAELIHFVPRFSAMPAVAIPYPVREQYAILVKTPDGAEYAIDDPIFTAFLKERFDRDLYARFSDRGSQDSRPLSLFGMATLRALEKEMNISLDHRRFRANIYAAWDTNTAFYEDTLVGKKLQIGEKLVIEISKKDIRCQVIALDPDTGEKNMSILSHVALRHENCAGVYAVVLREGIVRRRDGIFLVS